jgi:hypothetical protein
MRSSLRLTEFWELGEVCLKERNFTGPIKSSLIDLIVNVLSKDMESLRETA